MPIILSFLLLVSLITHNIGRFAIPTFFVTYQFCCFFLHCKMNILRQMKRFLLELMNWLFYNTIFNTLTANSKKRSDTLKKCVRSLRTIYLSVLDHFLGLVLRVIISHSLLGYNTTQGWIVFHFCGAYFLEKTVLDLLFLFISFFFCHSA